ncbi:MAG: LysM peptidoglycan-binding domain-containing protein [Phycisphaerae bacterium]|jgi:nucleoid-associated protein YgaU
MKSRHIGVLGAIGLALVTGGIIGCENNKSTGMTTATNEPPPPPQPERYPAEPEPAPVAAATPGPSTATPPTATPGGEEVYTPAAPVDQSRALPPDNRPSTARRRSSPAPAESYQPPARGGTTYTVKKGDTLQKISQKFYGTTTKWRKIQQANAGKIKDGDKIYVGMKLTIPPK